MQEYGQLMSKTMLARYTLRSQLKGVKGNKAEHSWRTDTHWLIEEVKYSNLSDRFDHGFALETSSGVGLQILQRHFNDNMIEVERISS